jgi:hypothetical protein
VCRYAHHRHAQCHNAKYSYAMLGVVILSVVMLRAVIPMYTFPSNEQNCFIKLMPRENSKGDEDNRLKLRPGVEASRTNVLGVATSGCYVKGGLVVVVSGVFVGTTVDLTTIS